MELDRRRFLQATLFSAAGVAVLDGGIASVIPPALADTVDYVDVADGTLLAMQGTSALLATSGTPEWYDLSGVNIWRGAYGLAPSALQVGDNLLVKTVDGTPVGAWSNLTRAKGLVASGGPTPTVQDFVTTQIANLAEASWYGSDNEPTAPAPTISPGDYLDVIGLTTPTGVVATRVQYISSSSLPISPDNDAVDTVIETVNGNCIYNYTGQTTWYCCGGTCGAPRCGACNPSNNNGLAWPALDSGCSGCSTSCCNCSVGCKNQVYLSCGAKVVVTDSCSGTTKTCVVATCGPAQNQPVIGCSRVCGNCSQKQRVNIIDLTKANFTRFYDPLSVGCFECKVSCVLTVPGPC